MTQPKTPSDDMPRHISAIRDVFANKLAELRAARSEQAQEAVQRDVQEAKEADRPRTHLPSWLERAQWRLKAAGVPDSAADALDVAEPEMTPALEAAQSWWYSALHAPRCLLLLGDVGVGKTTAAAWCVREAIAAEFQANRPSGYETRRLPPALFILASTAARMGLYGANAHEDIERLCNVRVLVLDDFGREKLSDVAAGLFDEILTRRLDSRRRTIITGNLDKVTLAERVKERITDRLREHGHSVILKGRSMRGRG